MGRETRPRERRCGSGGGADGGGAARWRDLALLGVTLALAVACGDAPERGQGGSPLARADSQAEAARTPSGSSALPPSEGLPAADSGAEHGSPSGEPSAGEGSAAADAEAARSVVERYYHAVTSGEYRQAYRMWEDGAMGRSYDEFRAGFAGTDRVGVTAGQPGRVEGAAGSRYVEIPVVVEAVTTRGERQRFEGTYTLRRSVVDGATEAQRTWRIYEAEINQVR